MSVDSQITTHYEVDDVTGHILSALAGAGVDTAKLSPEDLAPVDEFHMGGAVATADLLDQMELSAGQTLLDVGSGIGGPARFAARHSGVSVTGIDLTPGYVATAAALSEKTGFAGSTRFVAGSALAMPFADGSFDAAMILHVGMNISDKAGLMKEVARVLKPKGLFAVYDVMLLKEGVPAYPVPWSTVAETSFLASPAQYRVAAQAAGFRVKAERERREFAVAFFDRMAAANAAATAAGKMPPPGLSINMGATAPTKIANLRAALQDGILAPVEMILRLG